MIEINLNKLLTKFKSVFERYRKFSSSQVLKFFQVLKGKLHVDEFVQSIAQRRFPCHVRCAIEEQIQRLDHLEIIVKVKGPQ